MTKSLLKPIPLPKGAAWPKLKRWKMIPKALLWFLETKYPHLLSDVWQSGYRQGARDARTADRMAATEKLPHTSELVTRTNQHVKVNTRRDEFVSISTPWNPFN